MFQGLDNYATLALIGVNYKNSQGSTGKVRYCRQIPVDVHAFTGCAASPSNFQNLPLFYLSGLIHLFDKTVRELLQAICSALQFVLRDLFLFLAVTQFILGIAAHIANSNFMFVQLFMQHLDHIAAPLLVHRRNSQADNLSIIIWIDAQIGSLYRLLNVG